MKVDTTKWTKLEQEMFLKGWKDAGGYIGDLDIDRPWCKPWTWYDPEIEVVGDSIYDYGYDFWKQYHKEIEEMVGVKSDK